MSLDTSEEIDKPDEVRSLVLGRHRAECEGVQVEQPISQIRSGTDCQLVLAGRKVELADRHPLIVIPGACSRDSG